jgi:hypothetical protein
MVMKFSLLMPGLVFRQSPERLESTAGKAASISLSSTAVFGASYICIGPPKAGWRGHTAYAAKNEA